VQVTPDVATCDSVGRGQCRFEFCRVTPGPKGTGYLQGTMFHDSIHTAHAAPLPECQTGGALLPLDCADVESRTSHEGASLPSEGAGEGSGPGAGED
jgi:hypothetical protein